MSEATAVLSESDRNILDLIGSFPEISDYARMNADRPFDVEDFKAQAWHSSNAKHAAKFVVSIYEGTSEVEQALQTWDTPHRTAFFRWAHSVKRLRV